MHKWAVEMSGRPVTTRRERLMIPDKASTEATMTRQVEEWEQELEELEDIANKTQFDDQAK